MSKRALGNMSGGLTGRAVLAVLCLAGGALLAAPVEVPAGTTLVVDEARTFGDVAFAGGTLSVATNFTAAACDATGSALPLAGVNDTRGVAITGTVTVSADSVVTGRTTVVFGLASATSTVQVASGATLTLATPVAGFIRKTGAGALRFLYPLDAPGALDLAEGTARFAARARTATGVRVTQAADAQLVLEEGAAYRVNSHSARTLLASAPVWFDADRLAGAEGDSVSSAPNIGTTGGAFVPFVHESVAGLGVPTLKKNAVNGHALLAFDGNQALGLHSYTNATSDVTMFLIWYQRAYRCWGGPFSLYPQNATGADNGNGLHIEVISRLDARTLLGSYKLSATFTNAAYTAYRPSCEMLVATPSNAVLCEYVGDAAALAACTGLVSNATWDFGVVCLGGRMGNGKATVPQWYGTNNGNNRMGVGDIGEMVVFNRALTADERKTVTDYLREKWFASSEAAAAERYTASSGLALTAVGAATVVGAVQPRADGGAGLSIAGTGPVQLAAALEPGAAVTASGALAFSTNALRRSRAQIWVDAADAETILCDDAGCVTNLANKGSCGGAFTVAPATSDYTDAQGAALAVKGPALNATAYPQEPPYLYFDRYAALMTEAYTNRSAALASRSIHVYMAIRRSANAQYTYAMSFASKNMSGNDHQASGVLRMMEYENTKVNMGLGSGKAVELSQTLATATTGQLLLALHLGGAGGTFGFENASATVARSFQFADLGGGGFNVDRVLLGGRFVNGCAAYKDAGGSGGANRLWKGYVGEFIVFDDPLSAEEETELLAYLRKKWLLKGEGAATPPAFLSGRWGAPDLADGSLALADNTAVEHACGPIAVKTLEAGANVSWTRPGTCAEPLFTGGFSFAGAQTLAFTDAEPADKSLVFAGTLDGANPAWTVRYRGRTDASAVIEPVAGGLRFRRIRGLVILFR